MTIELDHIQGLIAGDGLLPIKMAQYAKENGFEVICISLSSDNHKELKKILLKGIFMRSWRTFENSKNIGRRKY